MHEIVDKTAPFRISRQELSYHRKAFLEQCKLMGRRCKLIVPTRRVLKDTTTSDIYDYDHSNELEYYIMLETDPSKKLLELFGFSKESENSRPLIAHCPMFMYGPHISEQLGNLKEITDETRSLKDILPLKSLTYQLGTITSSDTLSDGYPNRELYDVTVSEGCIIMLAMYNHNSTDIRYESYTVEQVLVTEDASHYIVNLVPMRQKSEGIDDRFVGDSGSRFIYQDDD